MIIYIERSSEGVLTAPWGMSWFWSKTSYEGLFATDYRRLPTVEIKGYPEEFSNRLSKFMNQTSRRCPKFSAYKMMGFSWHASFIGRSSSHLRKEVCGRKLDNVENNLELIFIRSWQDSCMSNIILALHNLYLALPRFSSCITYIMQRI